eukprot:10153743-Prorocentrum_lima.AAC.1
MQHLLTCARLYLEFTADIVFTHEPPYCSVSQSVARAGKSVLQCFGIGAFGDIVSPVRCCNMAYLVHRAV